MENQIEQDTAQLWGEVAAERAGQNPVKPAAKPVITSAAEVPPVAQVKPDSAPDYLAKFAEMEARFHKTESSLGRINADLKAQLEASKTAAKVTDGPTQAEIKTAAANPAEWDLLKADFPEWATATEKLLEARMAPAFDSRKFEAEIKEQMRGETAAVRAEIIDSALDAVSPGWKEEVKSEAFTKWFAGQPDNIKALTASDKVGDAAKMLRLYDVARQANPANKIIEQRNATLAAATGAPKGTRNATASKSWADMSPAERWESEKRTRAKSAR